MRAVEARTEMAGGARAPTRRAARRNAAIHRATSWTAARGILGPDSRSSVTRASCPTANSERVAWLGASSPWVVSRTSRVVTVPEMVPHLLDEEVGGPPEKASVHLIAVERRAGQWHVGDREARLR